MYRNTVAWELEQAANDLLIYFDSENFSSSLIFN